MAVVAIGRNEGQRLVRCLSSVKGRASTVVYVDSGSDDGSVEHAKGVGALVVALDTSIPFTAARARNEGLRAALKQAPDLRYVQFVDGDCEVVAEWLGTAQKFLDQHADVVAVCGRRRERHPEASLYNQLCDLEWNTPVGECRSFGGDVMIRVPAFLDVGGYRDDVIAGEEPELCVRLRAAKWRIWRLDAEMTLHDAAIMQLRQWWLRARRCGYAYALGAHLHGQPTERHWVAETRRAIWWGLALPLSILCVMLLAGPIGGLLLLVYPLQAIRLSLRSPLKGKKAWQQGGLLILTKFAEMAGVARFWRDRHRREAAKIIEYK